MSNTIFALLSATTAISHGDPGASNTSNVTPFRMQEVLYQRPDAHMLIADDEDAIGMEPEDLRTRNLREAEAAIRELAEVYPLPERLAAALQSLKAEEFLATAFTYSLISQLNALNGGDGEGLFSGMERYDQLLKRLSIVSSQYQSTFFSLYAALLSELRIESTLSRFIDLLWRYATLPRAVQQAVIATLGKERQSVVTIARAWFDESRKSREQDYGLFAAPTYDPSGRVAGASLTHAEAAIPHVSANALRHVIFRETLRDHLLAVTGLGSIEDVVQAQRIPPYVSMLLSNGGNVKGGAREPDNSQSVTDAIKRMFPSIALLGGCVPTHIMAGCLSVANWTLCMQNNQSTMDLGYTSDIDASALLSIETHTRHVPSGMSHSKDAGQMLFSHTVMKQGAQLLLSIGYTSPFVSDLTRGAAFFAFKAWLANGGQVGGRDGTGEGRLRLVGLDWTRSAQEEDEVEALAINYAEYVEQHADDLYSALVTGNLGWRERLASWA